MNPRGHTDLLFLEVPERKQVKNRRHPGLRPEHNAAEIARAGRPRRYPDERRAGPRRPPRRKGRPDGNELCGLRAFTREETDRLALKRRDGWSSPVLRPDAAGLSRYVASARRGVACSTPATVIDITLKSDVEWTKGNTALKVMRT